MSGRRVASVGLIVLTCALTLVASVALWLRALVLNADAYVRAIGPVLDQPAVRDALAESIVGALYDHVDVAGQLRTALPESAAEYAPTLAASIRATAVQLASAALSTDAVRQAWRQANRIAHDQVVHVLEGKGDVVSTARGEVAVDIGALTREVRASLDEHGIRVFDHVSSDVLDTRFVLFRSTDLMHAQRATRALDALATWLPIAAVASGVGAVASAVRRRRATAGLAVGIAAVMVLVTIGAAVGRAYYLARVGATYRTIAAAPFDALVSPLRAGARLGFAVACIAGVVVWVTESRSFAARERRAWAVVAELASENAGRLAWAGLSVAAIVLVGWDKPRPAVVYTILVVLGVWELVCAVAARDRRLGGAGGASEPD